MAADDIQTSNALTGGAADALGFQGTATLVSADALGRWTRAVAGLPARTEQNTRSPEGEITSEPHPQGQEQAQATPEAGVDHFQAAGTRQTDASASGNEQSASSHSGAQDRLPSALGLTQPPIRADVLPAEGLKAVNSALPAPQATPSVAFALASPRAAQQAGAVDRGEPVNGILGAATAPSSGRSTAVSPTSVTALLPRDREPPVHVAFGANQAPVQADQIVGEIRVEGSSQGKELEPSGRAPLNTRPTSVQNDATAARAFPLSALRGLHDTHRFARRDVGLLDAARSEPSSKRDTQFIAPTDGAVPLGRTQKSPETGGASEENHVADAANGRGQLHALIESCCSRLWVSDGAGHVPQGVMLDLGRWMPGCTVELAKASGVLRITLRGVDSAERSRLEDELRGLGEELAEKLGCQVVAGVSAHQELT